MCNIKFSDLGNFKFASGRYKNSTICTGSLYFENGRIRLAHCEGPCVELFEGERLQLIVPDNMNIDSAYYKSEVLIRAFDAQKEYKAINNQFGLQNWGLNLGINLSFQQIPTYLTKDSCLLEIEKIDPKKNNGDDYWVHVSRGVPYITTKLQNICYKEIFNAALMLEKSDVEISNKKIQDIAMSYGIFTSL